MTPLFSPRRVEARPQLVGPPLPLPHCRGHGRAPHRLCGHVGVGASRALPYCTP
jgi:hypothetical protein